MPVEPQITFSIEWFEWPYDRLEQYPTSARGMPAHVTHRDRRP